MSNSMQQEQAPLPQPLVSVVMPVRDQERVLRQALESVCAQSLQDFELLVVDDGSTDDSLAIEREFAGRDPRIRLFPRTAEGAAPARNYGLSAATGRYVIFLDSDDLFHPDLLRNMASILEATAADICICEADGFRGEEGASFGDRSQTWPYTRLVRLEEGLYNRRSFGRTTFQVGGSTPWNKMYRRKLLVDADIQFQNTKCNNDCFFVAKAMWEADAVYLLKETLVLHRKGLGTSIQDRRHNHPQESFRVANKLFDDIGEKSALSNAEASSLRALCSTLLIYAAGNHIANGTYDELTHERIVAKLRYWGSPGFRDPRRPGELLMMARRALITHAPYDRVVWAHSRWMQNTSNRRTSAEKLELLLRIAIAIVLGDLPVLR